MELIVHHVTRLFYYPVDFLTIERLETQSLQKAKQDGYCESVRSTECSNIPLKVAKTTSLFYQRKRWEYLKVNYMH